ncbi:hypothetical protein ACKFKG_07655 [Phormidesmis sp. 146-35]
MNAQLRPSQQSLNTLGSLLMGAAILFALPAQPQMIVPQATAAARVKQREQQVQQIRPDRYDLTRYPVTDANERYWRNLLWSTAITEPQSAVVDKTIAQILSLTTRRGLSSAQTRTVEMAMQVGTQLYLSNPTQYESIQQQFQQTIERSSNAEWAAMSLSALAQSGAEREPRKQWSDRLQQRFPQWRNNPHLFTTLQAASSLDRPRTTPPLKDLLNWTIAPGQLQMYVICRPDRGTLCQTVLKDRRGQFVREKGELWSAPLLTRSLHGLASIFTRGQTPQGIYRIEGSIPQPDTEFFRAYGTFPLVNLFVPSEPGVKAFLPDRPGQIRGLSAYRSLLPPSWRNDLAMQQSYWAGRVGRGLFRIHGSGEAPTFFTNNSRYPASAGWNPTIGCLSALELYDQTGQLQQADMPKILNVLTATGGRNFTGYLIVVEVPDLANKPIAIEEIEAIVNP